MTNIKWNRRTDVGHQVNLQRPYQESVGPGKTDEHRVRPAMTNIKWDQRFDVGHAVSGEWTMEHVGHQFPDTRQTRNDNGAGAAGPPCSGHSLAAPGPI